jgi:hypothetical protein
MSILADTNILLRRTQPDHPSHTLAVESVAKLLSAGEPVYFTLQNISEFWNVATRPAPNNGLGFSVALVLGEIERIERFLTLRPGLTCGVWGMEAPGASWTLLPGTLCWIPRTSRATTSRRFIPYRCCLKRQTPGRLPIGRRLTICPTAPRYNRTI